MRSASSRESARMRYIPIFRSGVGPDRMILPASCCCFIQTRCSSSVTVHWSRGFAACRCARNHILFSFSSICPGGRVSSREASPYGQVDLLHTLLRQSTHVPAQPCLVDRANLIEQDLGRL